MQEEKKTTNQQEVNDEISSEDGTELDETDLDSVAGGATWHPETIDSLNKSWDETPGL